MTGQQTATPSLIETSDSSPLPDLLPKSWGQNWPPQGHAPFGDETRPYLTLTLRVDQIAPTTSSKQLAFELDSIITECPALRGQVDGLAIRSITPRGRTCSCASVTIRTQLVDKNKLLTCLEQASNAKAYPYRYDCSFYGITPLYEDAIGAHCDIVAVPGLGSHAIGSWKSPGGDDLWLRDWLPNDIHNIRVMLYGYDTKLLKSESKSSMVELGRSFLESLTAFRKSTKTERRPIILIGHSLGGLLIKEASLPCSSFDQIADSGQALIIAARSSASRPTHHLSQVCCGLLFFGVPQLGLRNEQLAYVVQGEPNRSLIHDLLVDEDSEPSTYLERMSFDFAQHFQGNLRVVCFFEDSRSATVQIQPDGSLQKTGTTVLMVTKQSATTTGLNAMAEEDMVPVHADHSGLVKFKSQQDDAYVIVKERILSLLPSAASLTKDPSFSPTRQKRDRVRVKQHGSAFEGSIHLNGGVFTQGNVINF